MRPADRDRPAQAHQFGEHFRAAHDWDQMLAGSHDFGIIRPHGGGDDHDLRVTQIGRVVADRDA